MTIDPLWTVPVATRRGILSGTTSQRAQQTLVELEHDLATVRSMGAPDDASVAPTAPGSVHLLEVLWAGPAVTQPARQDALDTLRAELVEGLGTHDCPVCNRGGPTVGVLPDGRTCPLCAGWGSL